MKTEFEAKIIKINKNAIRNKLKILGAKLYFTEKLFTRITFDNPELRSKNTWVRLRNEGGKITLALKSVKNEESITGTKETSFVVDNFDSAFAFIKSLGLKEKNKQQNYREEWRLGKVIFDIDTWPLIDPYIEVEGPNKNSVMTTVKKLGYKDEDLVYGSSDVIYKNFYGIDILSKPELVF